MVFRSWGHVNHSAQTHHSIPTGHQWASKKPILVMPWSSLKVLERKQNISKCNKIPLFDKKMAIIPIANSKMSVFRNKWYAEVERLYIGHKWYGTFWVMRWWYCGVQARWLITRQPSRLIDISDIHIVNKYRQPGLISRNTKQSLENFNQFTKNFQSCT